MGVVAVGDLAQVSIGPLLLAGLLIGHLAAGIVGDRVAVLEDAGGVGFGVARHPAKRDELSVFSKLSP